MKTLAVFLESEVPVFRPSDASVARLAALLGGGWRVRAAHDEASFLAILPEADAAVVWTFRQEWFASAPRLRALCTPAAGKDYFRVTPPPGVELRYGSFHGAIMGETAAACVLSLSHGLFQGASLMTARGGREAWPRPFLAARARRLAGATCAILGFGAIGSAAARFLKPFGARIAGIARTAKPRPAWFGPEDATFAVSDAAAALRDASFLVSFLPSGPETDGLVDAALLSLLPPGAFFLNFGRGNCVDENALAAALASGRLAGAVLDVYREEPLPLSSPLRDAPNAWLFPHSSAFSPDYVDLCFDELSAFLKSW